MRLGWWKIMNSKQVTLLRSLKIEWSEINQKIDKYEKQIKEWSIAKEKNEQIRKEIEEIISRLEGEE